MKDMIDSLTKSLEMDIFGGWAKHERGLRETLGKLGVKSAMEGRNLLGGSPLQIESLDATLRSVSFDDKDLKLWQAPNVINSKP